MAANGESSEGGPGVSRIQCSAVPLPLEEQAVKELVQDARDFALLHGAGMRYKDSYCVNTLSMAPFFLFPTPFPKRDFEKVYELQPLINKLMYKVANNHDFLEKCLKNTVKVDEFTRQLWELYCTVRREGIAQPVALALLRHDVMLDTPTGQTIAPEVSFELSSDKNQPKAPIATSNAAENCCTEEELACPVEGDGHDCAPSVLCCSAPKQVEINTIASSFAALSVTLHDLQQYVLNRMGRHDLIKQLPPNNALEGLCSGMIAAWDYYNSSKAILLFVVEDVTYNICDQRFHEYEIMRQRPDITVLRRSLTQIHQQATLDQDRRLWLGSQEVAVVYYRSGYDPSLYHGAAEWAARLTVERSRAVKCPSVAYHLAGTKKVQQELAAKGALLQFLPEDEANRVKEIFAGLYSLDLGPEGDASIQMALDDPDRFVLKPQREGGGHNIYGADITETLKAIGSSHEREAYILMERIRAPVQRNYLVRPTSGEQQWAELTDVISELGIFGALLGSPDKILLNTTCGHMLRSKLATNNEGGVASGNGALDSVLLVP